MKLICLAFNLIVKANCKAQSANKKYFFPTAGMSMSIPASYTNLKRQSVFPISLVSKNQQ
jgi:hypothetical protein